MKSMIKELWRGNVMQPEDSRRNTPEMKHCSNTLSSLERGWQWKYKLN